MITVLAAIFVFFLVVIIHELGHFTVAKLVGIKVHEFSIGMGPKLASVRKGETQYNLRAIPIGGYVKMEGEDEASNDERSFGKKSVLARIAVLVAGAFMNFILAIIVYGLITLISGAPTTTIDSVQEGYPEYAAGLKNNDIITSINDKKIRIWDQYINEISNYKNKQVKLGILREGKSKIIEFTPELKRMVGISPENIDSRPTTRIIIYDTNLPAYKAGIRTGDKITQIMDAPIKTWDDVVTSINESSKEELKITVLRDEREIDFIVKPINQVMVAAFPQYRNDIMFSIRMGFEKTVFYMSMIVDFIGKLFRGQVGGEAVAGPVGVINLVGEAAKLGFIPLLSLAGFISINLGVFNLLPIPALDGSRIMFLLIEMFRGKPINPEKEGLIHFIGFVFLILLMIFVTYRDIIRLDIF